MIRCIAFTLIIMTSIGLTGCGTNSKSDLEYVKNKGTLVVGLDDAFAPMGFRDKADKLVGFDIDLARAVTKKMRIKVKFQPIDWSAKEGNSSQRTSTACGTACLQLLTDRKVCLYQIGILRIEY